MIYKEYRPCMRGYDECTECESERVEDQEHYSVEGVANRALRDGYKVVQVVWIPGAVHEYEGFSERRGGKYIETRTGPSSWFILCVSL